MAIQVGGRVSLTEEDGRKFVGTVMNIREDGILHVKWDTDILERIHHSEVEEENNE